MSKNSRSGTEYMRDMPDAERLAFFSSAPTETGCILWTGSKNSRTGYGRIRINGKRTLAHRAAYELRFGPIPDGMHLLHQCDNPYCINPEHMHVGTHKDNMVEKSQRGRYSDSKGEKHPSVKLTESQVLAIRNDVRINRIIANDYGVSKSTVGYIKQRKLWPHI